MKLWMLGLIALALIVVLAAIMATANFCGPNDPAGPTIGHVLKIKGC